MFNSSTSLKQPNAERQDLKIASPKSELNTDLYSDGYFIGYIGAEPSRPEDDSYWQGYRCPTGIQLASRFASRSAIGHREYWATKLGVEIPD